MGSGNNHRQEEEIWENSINQAQIKQGQVPVPVSPPIEFNFLKI